MTVTGPLKIAKLGALRKAPERRTKRCFQMSSASADAHVPLTYGQQNATPLATAGSTVRSIYRMYGGLRDAVMLSST